jgi:hypothetical protein
MKRILALAALCLALAACFKSERLLLDLGMAAHPVADGEWTAGEGADVQFSLASKGDHYVRTEGDNKYDVVLAPLSGHADTYIAAEAPENCTGNDASDKCNWEYAIVIVGKDGTWKQFAPACKNGWDGMDRDVAKREDDGETCWFDDAARLQHALGIAADRGGTNVQEFHRPSATATQMAEPDAPVPEDPAPEQQ